MAREIRIIVLLVVLTSFIACHSVKYIAIYEFKPADNIDTTLAKSAGLVKRLAKSYKHDANCFLFLDDKYKHNDTIAYFGLSYHYFTFTFKPSSENNILVKLDYRGSLSNGECYKPFLSAITDSLHKEFKIVKTDIRDYRK